MKKWAASCTVLFMRGIIPHEKCPAGRISGEKFMLVEDKKAYASVHIAGIGELFPDDVLETAREKIIELLSCASPCTLSESYR